MRKVDYLIIGNGIAGLSAAKEIRKNDNVGSITMVSNEPYLTYYRVKLTEYMSKDFNDEDLLVHDDNWYVDNHIETILSKIVERIDTDNNKVVLDDGNEISYEKLLLAMGSRPFVPPIAGKYKKGVFALRNLKDLRYIQNYFSNCEIVSIIGGGLLGLEAAWSIKKLNKTVNVIQHSPFLLSRQLDEEISRKVERKLREEGFNLYLDSSAEEILGETKANGIKLNSDKVIKTDAVLVSSGVRSNLDLIRETNIEYDRGVKVDEYLRTKFGNIYAAGDIAEVGGSVLGLWTASNEQGKIVGGNMTGNEKSYTNPRPYTTLQLGDLSLFSAGDVKDFDRIYEYKEEEKEIHHKLFTTDGKITGVILFGDISPMVKLKKAVVENIDVNEYLKDGISFK